MNMRDWRSNGLLRVGWPVLGFLGLLLTAAWVEPLLVHRSFPRTVMIGGEDLGVAQGWSAKEVSDALPSSSGAVSSLYRWSGASSELIFTSVARRQAELVTLRLLSGRPDSGAVVPVRLFANEHILGEMAVGGLLRRYHVLVPGALANQDSLRLRLDAPTFSPPGSDDRPLGVIGLDARIAEAGPALWLPHATLPLFMLSLAALLLAGGQPIKRTVPLVGLALIVVVGTGLFIPAMVLAAARTLAQLLLVAALALAGRRWWRRNRPSIRHPLRWGTGLLVLAIALTLTPTMSADGVEYYAYLRSLVVDHNLDFTNEYKGPEVPFDRLPTWLVNNRSKQTGYVANLASVGPAIVWAPFYLVGDTLAASARSLAWIGRPTATRCHISP